MLQTIALSAGQAREFREEADFFRLLATTTGAVDVTFLRDGAVVTESPGVASGYAEKFDRAFDTVTVTSAVAQTVQFVTRYGSQVSYDTTTGSTLPGAFTQAAPAINTASGQLLAAKSNRSFLQVQNNDPAVTVYLNVTGAAASAATGIKLNPGGSFDVQGGICPTAQINAIAIGSATSLVTVVEG